MSLFTDPKESQVYSVNPDLWKETPIKDFFIVFFMSLGVLIGCAISTIFIAFLFYKRLFITGWIVALVLLAAMGSLVINAWVKR